MAELQTNLNIAPFFDDFDENKQYCRILFRPATAVQARELTQLQTILQWQISKFGNSIYKDGSIIEGCGFKHSDFYCIRFKDNSTNSLDFNTIVGDLPDVANSYLLVSNTSGLRAAVFRAYGGTESAVNFGSLDTNRAYIRYVTSGNNAGIEVNQFNQTSEQIDVYNSYQDKTGILNAANKLGVLYTLTSNNTVNALGIGYGLRLSEGVIYQKGFFLKTLPTNIIIKENTVNAAGMVVGFDTKEYIVSSVEDDSLYDNSIGSPNYNAPGAYRLKLVPEPVYYDASNTQVTIPANFLNVLSYDGGDGRLVINNTNPQYSTIMDTMAKRTSEEAGDFVVNAFQVDVTSYNANVFYYNVSAGIGYVDGYRVEFLSPKKIFAPRALTTNTLVNQIVTSSYGNYVQVYNYAGIFDFNNLDQIDIYDAPQAVLTLDQSRTSPIGNKIGTAAIKALSYENGRKGTSFAIYNFYIFNVKMNPGKSFTNDAKSFYVNNTYGKAYADILLDGAGKANVLDSNLTASLFDTGLASVKRLTNGAGENNTLFVYKAMLTGTLVPSSGRSSVSFSTTGTDIFDYGIGTISDIQQEGIDLLFAQDTTTNALITNGNIDASTETASDVSSTDDFTSAFNVGDGIVLSSGATKTYHTVNIIYSSKSVSVVPSTTLSGTGTITVKKFFKQGTPIDLFGSGNTFVIDSSTLSHAQLEVDPDSPSYNIIGLIPVGRPSATAIEKVVHKNTYIKIDCSTHPSGTIGPWPLGLPDAYKIANVHFGASYDEVNPDKNQWFTLDNGQRDAYYGISELVLDPAYAGSLDSSSKLLVKLNHFSANITSLKSGFFSVDSYPIDDSNSADTNTTIRTLEVPLYIDTSLNTHDLKNFIDFRSVMANTADIATTISSATVNPANNDGIFLKGDSNVVPMPDQNFIYDVEFYLPRIDILLITKNSDLVAKLGTPALKPKLPSINKAGMSVAEIFVPPYPSLTFKEAE